jgi:hypothetical protein
MHNEHLSAGCGFWLLWVAATTCGWILGALVNDPIVRLVGGTTYWAEKLAPLYWLLLTAITGTTVGIAQGLVLRRRAALLLWVTTSAFAWSLGEMAEMGTILGVAGRLGTWPSGVPLAWHWLVKWLVVGLSAGVLQWLVLRRTVFSAGWWILASTLGWTTGGLAREFISDEFSFGIEFLVGGLTAGGVTGVFFVVAATRLSLTQLPPPEPPPDSQMPPC